MASESDGRNIATTKSGHKVVAGPEVSNNPPPPPAGPVPVPYVIAASSSSAKPTGEKLKIAGGETVHADSVMDADPPGNAPSKPTGGDVVTFAVQGSVPVTSATGTCTVSGKDVARTGDTAAVNTASAKSEFRQWRDFAPQVRGGLARLVCIRHEAAAPGSWGILRTPRGNGGRRGPGALVHGVALVREFLPTVVHARREGVHPGHQQR